jgi:hypothetical protein
MGTLKKLSLSLIALASAGIAGNASAYVIYGNSASFGNNPIHQIDSTTGIELQRNIGQASGNGRGVVTVGNTLYYTVVGDAHIYMMDRTTGLNTGSILTQNSSMSTLAWDGTSFWTADYSGTNRAFKIDPLTGNNIATITLANAQYYMDGLEYFNGKLIGNRCDACGVYDIYDLNGNVLVANFINTGGAGTGIAFDGTDFLVSNLYSPSIGVYDGTTGLLKSTINLTGNGSFLIEDLSVDYAQREDTGGGGGGQVPEPASLAILGVGLAAFAAQRRRRQAK